MFDIVVVLSMWWVCHEAMFLLMCWGPVVVPISEDMQLRMLCAHLYVRTPSAGCVLCATDGRQ